MPGRRACRRAWSRCGPSCPGWRTGTPLDGWNRGEASGGNPFPSAYLLAFLLLARVCRRGLDAAQAVLRTGCCDIIRTGPARAAAVAGMEPWLADVPAGRGLSAAAGAGGPAADGGCLVRLSPAGPLAAAAWASQPAAEPVYPQTLLVQPNLEILAYRQGLTPALIAQADAASPPGRAWARPAPCSWSRRRSIAALETGETFETIRLTLEQHGIRAIAGGGRSTRCAPGPTSATASRSIPSATLLEFASADDLTEALARGLPAVRIADAPGDGGQRGGDRLPPFPPDRHARLRPAAGEVRRRSRRTA